MAASVLQVQNEQVEILFLQHEEKNVSEMFWKFGLNFKKHYHR